MLQSKSAVVFGYEPPATLEHPMFDLALVVVVVSLFGLMIAYAYACDRL